MATFPQYTLEHWRSGVTGAEGWVWYSWALEHRATVWGTGVKYASPGYVRQETLAILERWRTRR